MRPRRRTIRWRTIPLRAATALVGVFITYLVIINALFVTGAKGRGEDSTVQRVVAADEVRATFGARDFFSRRVRLRDTRAETSTRLFASRGWYARTLDTNDALPVF